MENDMTDEQFKTEMDLLIFDENDEIIGVQGLPDEFDYSLVASEIPEESSVLPLEHQAVIWQIARLTRTLGEINGIDDVGVVYDTFLERDVTFTESVHGDGTVRVTVEFGRSDVDDFTWRWVRHNVTEPV